MGVLNPYKTVRGESQGEYEEKRSRFLSYLTHVESEEEAIEFRHGIRELVPDASHYVSAYIIHENNLIHFSDAKEPQGTAGMPVLTVVQHAELEDVVCVVARIFGGTLLGKGGLMRAYTKAAQLAVEQAHVVTVAPCKDVMASIEYPLYEPMQRFLKSAGVEIGETTFGSDVTMEFRVLSTREHEILDKMSDLCNGNIEFDVGEERFQTIDTGEMGI